MRKYSNLKIVKVKEFLSQGYSNKAVIEMMKIKYNTDIPAYVINDIKQLRNYSDVKPELNESILNHINFIKSDEIVELITNIKKAIVSGYSDKKIKEKFKISNQKLARIKHLSGQSFLIGKEYNDDIIKSRGKLRKDITKEMICSIKKDYADRLGEITFTELASHYDIDISAVSNILNLKNYVNNGQKYNKILRQIKKKKREINTRRKIVKNEKDKQKEILNKLNAERKSLDKKINVLGDLYTERKKLDEKIRKQRKLLSKMKLS